MRYEKKYRTYLDERFAPKNRSDYYGHAVDLVSLNADVMSCIKRKFYSKKEAKKFMRVQNLKYSNEEPLTQVYQCLDCNFWHVTHKDKYVTRDKKHNNRLNAGAVSPELEKLRLQVKAKNRL